MSPLHNIATANENAPDHSLRLVANHIKLLLQRYVVTHHQKIQHFDVVMTCFILLYCYSIPLQQED